MTTNECLHLRGKRIEAHVCVTCATCRTADGLRWAGWARQMMVKTRCSACLPSASSYSNHSDLKASRAASMVAVRSASLCAALTKPASYSAGAM